MKRLILWSGGVESTSLLKQYLSETQDEIFAHYIRMVNPEGRKSVELKAIETLFPMLNAIRGFNLSFSDISICNGKALPNDIKVLMMIGSAAMYYHKCDALYVGCALEDRDIRTTVNGVHTVIPRPDTWWSDFQWLLQAFLKPGDSAKDMLPYHPSGDWPKKQHMDYLGELLQYTHSCRRPDTCQGTCHSCRERNA